MPQKRLSREGIPRPPEKEREREEEKQKRASEADMAPEKAGRLIEDLAGEEMPEQQTETETESGRTVEEMMAPAVSEESKDVLNEILAGSGNDVDNVDILNKIEKAQQALSEKNRENQNGSKE